jgi:16S rRNA G966 N2-methylase RsmD
MAEIGVGFPFEYLVSCADHDKMLAELQKIAKDKSLLNIIRVKVYGKNIEVLLRSYPANYYSTDSISNYYTEKLRLCVSVSTKDYKKSGGQPSPMQKWETSTDKKIVSERLEKYLISPNESDRAFLRSYRDSFYKSSANLFNPCIMLALLHKYKLHNCRILDPTSGWGDRLIASLIFGAKEYVGYDTNTQLAECYENIVCAIGAKTKTRFNFEPFEYGQQEEGFDLVFTSPPFFDVELYDGDKTSTMLYKTREEWDVGFYEPFLRKSARALVPNGHIMLYIPYEMFTFANSILSTMSFKLVETFGFYQKSSTDGGSYIDFKKIRYVYVWVKDY